MTDRKTRVRQFLARFSRQDLGDEDDIFALGFVNSLLAIQLVQFIEREFGVSIDEDDLDFANFRSLDAIDAFVEGKLASTRDGG